MNPQLLGLKFELWGEQLFKDLNGCYPLMYTRVRRNVNYFRGSAHRQVDVEYFNVLSHEPFVILEFKYCSNGHFPLMLRNGKDKGKQKIGRIENVLEELEDRRRFVCADQAILVTNKRFEQSLEREARNYKGLIKLYDQGELELLDRDRTTVLSSALRLFGYKGKSIEAKVRETGVYGERKPPYQVRVGFCRA